MSDSSSTNSSENTANVSRNVGAAWVMGGLAYTEMMRQEYTGNNCIISAGFVEGEDKPIEDTIYVRLEKDGVEPTTLLLRPDEAQALAWVTTGAIWSHLIQELHEKEQEAEPPESESR